MLLFVTLKYMNTPSLQQNEESLGVWQAVLHHLHTWAHILTEGPGREGIHRMLVKITSEIYAKLGWKDEGSHVRKLLRQKILTSVLDAGHPEAIKKAKELFDGQMAGKAGVAANLQELVYSVGVREGGAKEWKWCWDRYFNFVHPCLKTVILKQVHQHQRALGEREPVEGPWRDEGCFHHSEVPGHDSQPGMPGKSVRYLYLGKV